MEKLKLDAVVHWSIPVNDLEAAEQFYGEILGLEHVGRLANSPMSCFKLGNHNILLCQRNDPIQRTVEQDGRLHHAFDVSPEMFDKACKFSTSSASRSTSRWIIVPADFSPDGNSSFSIPAAIVLNCATPVGRRACRRRRMRRSSHRDRCASFEVQNVQVVESTNTALGEKD